VAAAAAAAAAGATAGAGAGVRAGPGPGPGPEPGAGYRLPVSPPSAAAGAAAAALISSLAIFDAASTPYELPPHGYTSSKQTEVRRCRLTVSKPVLKAPLVSALETKM